MALVLGRSMYNRKYLFYALDYSSDLQPGSGVDMSRVKNTLAAVEREISSQLHDLAATAPDPASQLASKPASAVTRPHATEFLSHARRRHASHAAN